MSTWKQTAALDMNMSKLRSNKANRFVFIIGMAMLFLHTGCELLPKQEPSKTKKVMKNIDWQGHRGARGLLPENTIPSFLIALSFPKVKTLEMDVVVSKDQQIVISHEPYFSRQITTRANGAAVTEADEKMLNIYEMTLEQIQTFDVGKRGNIKFPDQVAMAAQKPTFKSMVKAVDEYCKKNNRPLARFNVELKSAPNGYDIYMPQPKKFVALLLREIEQLNIKSRTNLQSFDTNILEEIHLQAPDISTALLIEELKTFDAHLSTISFKPTIFSPYFELVTSSVISQAKAAGIKVVPWTVNELKDLQRMVDLGVDGIITDYPNKIDLLHLAVE